MLFAGMALLKYSPSGVSFLGVSGVLLAFIGALTAFSGAPLNLPKRFLKYQFINMIKIAVAALSGALFVSSAIFILLYFMSGEFPFWTLSASAALLALSSFGVYYGAFFLQNIALLKIGEKLNLEICDSGYFGKDGKYDIKGIWNSVNIRLDMENGETGSKYDRKEYSRLEVLCEAQNSYGLEFEVSPYLNSEDFPPYWDYYQVKTNDKNKAYGMLGELRKNKTSVFWQNNGFERMSLSDNRLKIIFRYDFKFEGESEQEKEIIKKVLDESSEFAKKLI